MQNCTYTNKNSYVENQNFVNLKLYLYMVCFCNKKSVPNDSKMTLIITFWDKCTEFPQNDLKHFCKHGKVINVWRDLCLRFWNKTMFAEINICSLAQILLII